MLSKLSLISLFLAFSVYGQSRPGGNFVDPEYSETQVGEKEQYILAAVQKNMGMCGEDEVTLTSMKDLYAHLSSIQNRKAVQDISTTDQVANKDDPNCEKPKFKIVSFQVTCLLSGVEESMYAFSKSKNSSQYMEQKLGVKPNQAKEMLQFMEYVNEPGFAIVRDKKKKTDEMQNKKQQPLGDEGKI
jgi:hypothetical protein